MPENSDKPQTSTEALLATPDRLSSILDDAGANATEAERIEFCKTHMARFKAPKDIEFGDLPKTDTGKIQKFKLREKEWRGHQRKVA